MEPVIIFMMIPVNHFLCCQPCIILCGNKGSFRLFVEVSRRNQRGIQLHGVVINHLAAIRRHFFQLHFQIGNSFARNLQEHADILRFCILIFQKSDIRTAGTGHLTGNLLSLSVDGIDAHRLVPVIRSCPAHCIYPIIFNKY